MNGYTQIIINGQSVGIKFGYLAIKEFTLATDKKRDVYYDKVDGIEQLSFIGIAKLLCCGYKNNCEVKEVEPTLNLGDFNDWVEGALNDEERKKQLADALNVFASSQYVKTLAEMAKNGSDTEEAKKKTEKRGSRKLKQVS